jgi:hypothetical protein
VKDEIGEREAGRVQGATKKNERGALPRPIYAVPTTIKCSREFPENDNKMLEHMPGKTHKKINIA